MSPHFFIIIHWNIYYLHSVYYNNIIIVVINILFLTVKVKQIIYRYKALTILQILRYIILYYILSTIQKQHYYTLYNIAIKLILNSI